MDDLPDPDRASLLHPAGEAVPELDDLIPVLLPMKRLTASTDSAIWLYAYLKRLCSVCRSDVKAPAESWKIMHACT